MIQANKSQEQRIAEHRRRQPLDRLKRAADLSTTKSKLWTQEQVDFLTVLGEKWFEEISEPSKRLK